MSEIAAEEPKPYRILSLDGGGAQGFYSLGVLKEIEGMVGCRLYEKFDLVFGTSTGAIIAALIALGYSVDEIHELYKAHVPIVMERKSASEKTKALSELAVTVFGEKKFDAVKTGVGIVTTKWVIERPMIFKGSVAQAHGRISGMSKVVRALLGFKCFDELAGQLHQRCHGASSALAQSRFQLRECHFDRIEVRRVGWQITYFSADRFDRLANAVDLVGAQVIHEDDIAFAQRGREHLLNISEERWPIHRAVNDIRRRQAIDA